MVHREETSLPSQREARECGQRGGRQRGSCPPGAPAPRGGQGHLCGARGAEGRKQAQRAADVVDEGSAEGARAAAGVE